jgi:hypothetical protein
MAYVARPIQQLSLKGPEIWILDWYGGLVENPRDRGGQSVECILTPCTRNPETATGLNRHLKRQIVATVGISAINAIGMGRQYVNGNLVPFISKLGFTEEVITFRFAPKREGTVHETMLNQVGVHDYSALINGQLTGDGVYSAVKVVHGLLTSTNHPKSPDKNASARYPAQLRVMFHELEIIRFYYTNSQHLVKSVFSDSFQEDKLERDVVFSKYEKPHRMPDADTCRFEYQMGFYHDDLPIIGRTLFDPLAMRGVRRVYQSMLVSTVNEISDRKTAYPRTIFPYMDSVELTLTGRRLKLKDGSYIFAVHRIESCDAPFPFESLSAQCAVQPGGEKKAPPGSPAAFPLRPPKVTGPGQKDGELDTEGQPLEDSGFVDCIPDKRRFLQLKDGYLRIEKARVNTHTMGEQLPDIFNPMLTKSSPGTPTPGQSESVRQKIIDSLEGSDSPFDMEKFIAILSRLKSRNHSWSVSTIALSENARQNPVSKVTYCGFPSIACPERKSVFRQFSFHDRAKEKRRHLVCAQILANGKYLYLLEAERRKNDQGNEMDAMPILVLWSNGFVKVENKRFQLVLTETVKNPSKTWPQDVSVFGLMRGTIDHRRESKAVKMGKSLSEDKRNELNLKDAVERIESFVTRVLELAR